MKGRLKFGHIVCLAIMPGLFGSCSKIPGSEKSRVIQFVYQGYGDTTCTLLYGNVFAIKKTGVIVDTVPISGADVKAEQNGKVVKTDRTGSFLMALDKGAFTLTIAKPGYQTLAMTNYISDPDRISNTAVVLAKGSGIDYFEIPIPKQ